MDLTDLIRHVAGEVYVADNDGFIGNWGMNNYYLYRLATDHVFHFIDWDKSEAFKDTPDYSIWHNHLDVPDTIKNRLWTRVMSYPDLKNQFLDTLLECANVATAIPPGSDPADTRGWMEREIEREYAQINAAVQADPEQAVLERSVSGGGRFHARVHPAASGYREESGRGITIAAKGSTKFKRISSQAYRVRRALDTASKLSLVPIERLDLSTRRTSNLCTHPQMRSGPTNQQTPRRTGMRAGDLLAAEFHKSLAIRNRSRRWRRDELSFAWFRREAEHVGQPAGVEAGGSPERNRRIDVGHRDDDQSLVERRFDFPPQPKREVGGVQQEQRARRRTARRIFGDHDLAENPRRVPVADADAALLLGRDPALRCRRHRVAVDAVDGDQPIGRPAHAGPPRIMSHSATASAFESDQARCSQSRNSFLIA